MLGCLAKVRGLCIEQGVFPMSEKSTTTRTIKSFTMELPPTQRAAIEKMLAGGDTDPSKLMNIFTGSSSSSGSGDTNAEFVVEIKGDAVIVNGRRYDSIDDVPSPDRERVESMRANFGSGSFNDIFNDVFGDGGTQGWPPAADSRAEAMPKPPGAEPSKPESAAPRPVAPGLDTLGPGAVPPSSNMRRFGWLLLVVFGAVVAWMVVR
jgi:hypothetical protein